MTNSPFDGLERPVWEKGFGRDERFTAALRIDPLLLSWGETSAQLSRWGWPVNASLSDQTIAEVRRFLAHWTKAIKARYLMVSLPPDFAFRRHRMCPAFGKSRSPTLSRIPPAHGLMLESNARSIPGSDSPAMVRAERPLRPSESLRAIPREQVSRHRLARENQHELCVLARKFHNLHIFGCWWFTNVPSVMEEMTRMRLELLASASPQHSDARPIAHLQMATPRRIIKKVLVESSPILPGPAGSHGRRDQT
jgi:hypothetical protein